MISCTTSLTMKTALEEFGNMLKTPKAHATQPNKHENDNPTIGAEGGYSLSLEGEDLYLLFLLIMFLNRNIQVKTK